MGSEHSNPIPRKPSPVYTRTGAVLVQVIVTFTIALTLGLIIGQRLSVNTWDGFILPQGTIKTAWEHNLTFSQRPRPSPKQLGRGFIHHPELAPFISNIAVFHQLHCLHAILVAYYVAVEESDVAKGLQRPDEYLQQTGTRMAPSHIRHCFDYLRQTLMCAADTNLEVLDPETHTTSGWGQSRRCRDYDEIVMWAEKWANSTDTGIVT
ncbi:hypothetical protein ANOM_005961 [Aspergillus nomiae NRRL 13137]|uniref:Oxidase ustYa n=1 Tax=Aspergillus nomiae NRRL (strain ATCC 15546 / NRRL 13137 / CBS 260.88 / M93) TaxID=1509407 RepID=A0A0L1J0U6_ASPN3|nr:uncharacterized protein ANOM_005961 [Aspergillus nomiae NRRL 13137]KNG85379.1 hypothetical protein ANOM_005961 [Aspergillus nomiae NRRL 13137]